MDVERGQGAVGVAREDPGAMLPRADGVVMQPPPDGLVAHGGHHALALRFTDDTAVLRREGESAAG